MLWTERTAGRAAALAELQDAARSLALAEPELPDSTLSPAGTSLATATTDVFYRTKAAAVWWMLRSIVGDDALKQALQTYRLDPRLDLDPIGLQRTLENSSHKDLRWFFDDWVYRDRGLPDLSIVSVTPSQLTSRTGLPAGWLVAVEVRNDGFAAAEVPVTVRSTYRIRDPAAAHPRPLLRLHAHRLRRHARRGPGQRRRRPRDPDQPATPASSSSPRCPILSLSRARIAPRVLLAFPYGCAEASLLLPSLSRR